MDGGWGECREVPAGGCRTNIGPADQQKGWSAIYGCHSAQVSAIGKTMHAGPELMLPVDHSVLHDEDDAFRRGDVLQRVAGNRDDVGQLARGERADAALPAE